MSHIEAMRNAVEAMDKHDYEMADHILCQAIARAEGTLEAEKHEVSQEPVAWMDKSGITHKHKHFEDMQPLYTHPQPKREPLTMFETEKLAKRFGVEWTTRIHALCNEAAHGIKEKNT